MMEIRSAIVLFLTCVTTGFAKRRIVPKDLLIGTATSAYQTEGAWNLNGKGESVWDRFVHTRSKDIADHSTSDMSTDFYHHYRSDVQLLKNLGFQLYRFSISWSRLLPSGFSNYVNPDGIRFYNNLIDELLANGIIPMITLCHSDLPQALQDLGGWANKKIAKWFADYAQVAFRLFGDRVQWWITINEPKEICSFSYGDSIYGTLVNSSGLGEYMCSRNVIMAHAAAYHVYKNQFQKKQRGRVSITIECAWAEAGTNTTQDMDAAERRRQFDFGLYAHPIYSKKGDFPIVVRRFVDRRSKAENYSESRLPVLTQREVKFVQGTYDFFGLNYYTTFYVKDKEESLFGLPSISKDQRVEQYQDPKWLTASFSYVRSVPWGLRKLLKYIKDSYGDPEILITENGFSDFGELNDFNRITYHKDCLGAVLDAMKYDQVRIKAYAAWTFLDNFEWTLGYTIRFGLYHVNFTDPNRTRTPKQSTKFFQNLISRRVLNWTK